MAAAAAPVFRSLRRVSSTMSLLPPKLYTSEEPSRESRPERKTGGCDCCGVLDLTQRGEHLERPNNPDFRETRWRGSRNHPARMAESVSVQQLLDSGVIINPPEAVSII